MSHNYSTIKEGKQLEATPLPVQRGFWQDKFLADTKQKLAQLYYKKPERFEKEKQVILGFYQEYEGLSELLCERWESFVDWFMKAPSPETITRCLRALKEEGTITLNSEQVKQRAEQEHEFRQFWGTEKGLRGDNGQ
ncbi:hypothetical protein ACFLX6_02610 [Chloroflexota bacterium]